MNNLMIFEGKEVEVFEYEGKILFNPRHVGECLGLKDSAVRMAIKAMNDNQVIKLTNLDVKSIDIRKLNNAGENFLTESGVYKLIFKSRKEEAEKFQDWVTDEVLPTIRKHGAYMTANVLDVIYNDPQTMIDLITKLKEEKEARLAVEGKNAKLIERKYTHDIGSTCTINTMADMLATTRTVVKKRLIDLGWCTTNYIGELVINHPSKYLVRSGKGIRFTNMGITEFTHQYKDNMYHGKAAEVFNVKG